MEYMFHDLVPGKTPVKLVADNLAYNYYPYTYTNTIVAVDGDTVVGMALSYPSSYHHITDEMKSFLPADRLTHLSDFYSANVANSRYLDALCVVESHRRQGIGEKLISRTKEKAVEDNDNALSLIVFADNSSAISVYKRTGFEVVQKVNLRSNEFIAHRGGCLLMKCPLS